MDTKSDHSSRQEAVAKVVFTITFLLIFAVFILLTSHWIHVRLSASPSVFDFVLLAFATVRLGRMVAYDRIMEPFRAPFTSTVPDKSGVGKTVIARGSGLRCSMGQLISCPICMGTWIAAILVYALYAFPGPAHVFILIAAAIGMAEVLNGLIEAFSWSGYLARTMVGTQMAAQKAPPNHEQTGQDSDAG